MKMTRVSLCTALASLMMFYGIGDVFASSNQGKIQNSYNSAAQKRVANIERQSDTSFGKSINVGGSIMSHGWLTFRDNYYHKQGFLTGTYLSPEDLRACGVSTDAVLYANAQGKNDALGIYYGGSVELDLPYVQKDDYVSFRSVNNRGAKVYLYTSLGDLGFGYQPGVDSVMKIDAFTIGAGDNSNLWMRYVNLRGIRDTITNHPVALPMELKKRYLENVFYLSTGLYSEGMFDGSNRFSRSKAQQGNSSFKSITNSLPIRFSYVSTNLGGLKLGISYAPFGYEENGVIVAHKGAIQERKVAVLKADKMPRGFGSENAQSKEWSVPVEGRSSVRLLMPMYEQVVNVAMAYDTRIKDIDLKLSMTSEYAKAKVRLLSGEVEMPKIAFPKMDNIKNVAFGGLLNYRGFKVAFSYGYLGRIDKVNNMYSWDEANSKFTLDKNDKIIINTDSTYFWTVGGGYEYNGLYLSAIYRGSNYSGNRLDEVSFGVEYDISDHSTKVEYKIFANYHNFIASSDTVLNPLETDGQNTGQVLLSGIRVKF